MPIRDTSEQNAFLDNQYGAKHGSAAPASHELALFNGDPMYSGVEITGGGYARVSIPNDATWPDAADGQKTLGVVFGAPTGAWDQATHWGLINPDTAALGYTDAFNDPLNVTAASSSGPLIQLAIYFADNVGA